MRNKNLAIHPGKTVFELLLERNMTIVDLEASSGIPEKILWDLIDGKIDITSQIAESLEKGFGIENTKSFWLNLQKIYEDDLKH